MKNLFRFALIVLIGLGGFACEGPEGPEGPAGPEGAAGAQGPAGVNAGKARVGEYSITLNKAEEFFVNLGYPTGVTVGAKDVVMVYVLSNISGTSPNQVLYWSPLPKSYFAATGGQVQINFEYSTVSLAIFLDGQESELTKLPAEVPLTFRLVVLPGSETGARMANGAKVKSPVDLSNYEAVAKYYNITEADVIKTDPK